MEAEGSPRSRISSVEHAPMSTLEIDGGAMVKTACEGARPCRDWEPSTTSEARYDGAEWTSEDYCAARDSEVDGGRCCSPRSCGQAAQPAHLTMSVNNESPLSLPCAHNTMLLFFVVVFAVNQ